MAQGCNFVTLLYKHAHWEKATYFCAGLAV